MVRPVRLPPSFEALYAEVRALPHGSTGEILEPGVLRTMGRPGRAHRHTAKGVLLSLGASDVGAGGQGWWIEVEAEIRLGDRLVVPDLAGWRVERVPELPEDNPIAIAPDWCCEVLSPSTARDDKRLKLPLYARSNIPWIWLVDPALELVEVYEANGGFPTLKATAAQGDRVVLPPFDHPLDLAAWWLKPA